MKLTGYDAIDIAEANGLTLNKYADPTEDAREGLTMEEARRVAAEDPSLIWLERPMYQEVTVTPHHAGFGEWQVGEGGELWVDTEDLLNAIREAICTTNQGGDIYELGSDELPASVEDIRGRIHNEPARIFAAVIEGEVTYFGISAR